MLQNDVIKCCKMMSHSNNCCVVHEPAICEDLDLHVTIFVIFRHFLFSHCHLRECNVFTL